MNTERLLQLATHLRQEKLPIEWDFYQILDPCGTAGCALGNMQFVFPEEFGREHQGVFGMFDRAAEWFGISKKQCYGLFMDEDCDRLELGFPHQADKLTPLQVAENIEWFVKSNT